MKFLNKQTISVLLGLVGLILPQFIGFEGLEPAGQIAFGIFLMAAIFWICEPIPIFATSLLIILLQVQYRILDVDSTLLVVADVLCLLGRRHCSWWQLGL